MMRCHRYALPAVLLTALTLAGCAQAPIKQPDRIATIIESQPSIRTNFKPGVGAAVAGGAAGGLLGNQIGKGKGKKLATILGATAGAAAGAVASGTTTNVPVSLVALRDDETGDVFHAMFDGQWRPGTKVRYVVKDGKVEIHEGIQ